MTILSLETLRQQITQQQSQLQALRRELEARQARLASLTSRKKDLQAQLQQVEKEIAALATGAKAATTAAAPKPAKAKLAPGRRPVGRKHPVSLANLIVTILREAGRPRTVRELAVEAKRRGFHSASQDFSKQVQNRVYELKIKGTIAPASGQPGYVLRGTTAKVGLKPSPAKTGTPREQPTLREVVTQILQRSRTPLTRGELAAEALKAGYRTRSKDLANVIGTEINKMDHIQHVAGEGYRLRKGKV